MRSYGELEDDLYLHCIEKCSAQLFRKKDPKCLSCNVWTNTIDFHADFKHITGIKGICPGGEGREDD